MDGEEPVEQPKKAGRPKKQPNTTKFVGFPYPAPKGYSAFPNAWFDEILSQIDNLAEQKIVFYVYRHTYGYQKPKEFVHITVDEYMHGKLLNGTRVDRGTGMSKQAVISGTKLAEKHGYIEYRTEGPANDLQKLYRLRYLEVIEISSEVNNNYPEVNNKQVQGEIKNTSRGKNQIPPQAHPITDNYKQNNQINNNPSNPTKVQEGRCDTFMKLPDYIEEWMEGLTRDWGCEQDIEPNVLELEEIYQIARMKPDKFYDMLFHAIKKMNQRHPKDHERILCFFQCLRELLGIENKKEI